MGFGRGELAFATQGYELKRGDGQLARPASLAWLARPAAGRVLDLGLRRRRARRRAARRSGTRSPASTSTRARRRRRARRRVRAGRPRRRDPGTRSATATTSCSPPTCSSTCATPSELLRQLRAAARARRRRSWPASRTSRTGTRALRVALGRFDYDRRGILDRGHLRFFTRRSFARWRSRPATASSGSSRPACRSRSSTAGRRTPGEPVAPRRPGRRPPDAGAAAEPLRLPVDLRAAATLRPRRPAGSRHVGDGGRLVARCRREVMAGRPPLARRGPRRWRASSCCSDCSRR